MGNFLLFDRNLLKIRPLADREHDIDISIISSLDKTRKNLDVKFEMIAKNIVSAKQNKSSIILMIGGHVIRSGVQNYIIDLMKRGYITCLAMNGSGIIHDFELSLIGASTESVTRYIEEGQFGLWKETGELNDIINRGYKDGLGMGEAVGKAIFEGNFPYKNLSLLSSGYELHIPITVHIGIGYDIIHQHPNCSGAAIGETSYRDFLYFAKVVEGLEGGVVMNFGSAVMAPEVFLKALSMARNVAHQNKRFIRHFTTLVCDLYDLPEDFSKEPSKDDASYYFRPWKTMLVRTIKNGGKGFYIKGKHINTIPSLWRAINKKEKKGKILSIENLSEEVQDLKSQGKKIILCHGCFDLMHPGHIKHLEAAKRMGDILVVTITPDVYIDKGEKRPVFNQNLRAESISALECVDYVAINKWPTACEILRLLKPHIYVKGQEYKNLQDKTGKIQKEAEVIKEIKGEIKFTNEIVFSSTKLINEHRECLI